MEVIENGIKVIKHVITGKKAKRINDTLDNKMKSNWDNFVTEGCNKFFLNGYQGGAFQVLFDIEGELEKLSDSDNTENFFRKAANLADNYSNKMEWKVIELGEGNEDEFYGVSSACNDIKNILQELQESLQETVHKEAV